MEYFNTPFSPLVRSERWKLNREIRELTNVIAQINLIDICKPFYPNMKEYTLFSAPHRTFSKIDQLLGHKATLNIQKME